MWPEDFGLPNGGPEHPPEHPEEELAAFALNALDGPEFQAVAQHVVQCFHCQEVLVGFQETAARLASAAPETPLPPDLKTRVLSTATQPADAVRPLAVMPPADPRWSTRRLRRWLAPTAIGVLSLMLAGAIGVIVADDREIDQLTAALQAVSAEASTTPSTAAATESIVNIAPPPPPYQRAALPAGTWLPGSGRAPMTICQRRLRRFRHSPPAAPLRGRREHRTEHCPSATQRSWQGPNR